MISFKKTTAALLLTLAAMTAGCAAPNLNKPSDVLFKEGEQYYQRKNYEDAIAQWKKVKESYQSPELTTLAEINIADAYFLNKDYIEAAAEYDNFRKLHPNHPQADFALYRQGLSHYNQINSIDTDQTPLKNSLQFFESYLKLYPTGAHRTDVQEKIRDCRDKQLQYEIYVGRFYLTTKAYKAAISRFESALLQFSEQSRKDEVLYLLGRSYLEDGQKSKGREYFGRLAKEFPDSTFISSANRSMDSFF
ncbi:MAG TPA: outer membrane protein assembly factor BamD [Desulfuromonadales bacterium]|nr:outer membrane protein assembly factor BamD [Desulfuromonadales bacterium]